MWARACRPGTPRGRVDGPSPSDERSGSCPARGRRVDHRGVRELAQRQHGLVTRAQIIELGGSDGAITREVAAGRWTRARRGVVVVGAAPPTWEQRVLAAVLAAGPGALASNRTAIRVWGLVGRSGRIEVLLGGSRVAVVPGVTVHRTRDLPPQDISRRGNIPVTSLARTLVDASAGQDGRVVASWVDEATRRLGLDLVDLQECLHRRSGPGHPPLGHVHEVVGARLALPGPGDSPLEVRALLALARAGLPAPILQHRVPLADGTVALLDLAYPAQQVAIELDGWSAHGHRSAFDRDRERANQLTLLGWRLYRFTAAMPDSLLVTTVRRALG